MRGYSLAGMMTQREIQLIIRTFVVNELIPGDAGQTLKDDESLFRHHVIDSVSILQLLAFVDNHFDLRIESEEVNAANFDSVARAAAYVQRKLAARPRQGGITMIPQQIKESAGC